MLGEDVAVPFQGVALDHHQALRQRPHLLDSENFLRGATEAMGTAFGRF